MIRESMICLIIIRNRQKTNFLRPQSIKFRFVKHKPFYFMTRPKDVPESTNSQIFMKQVIATYMN